MTSNRRRSHLTGLPRPPSSARIFEAWRAGELAYVPLFYLLLCCFRQRGIGRFALAAFAVPFVLILFWAIPQASPGVLLLAAPVLAFGSLAVFARLLNRRAYSRLRQQGWPTLLLTARFAYFSKRAWSHLPTYDEARLFPWAGALDPVPWHSSGRFLVWNPATRLLFQVLVLRDGFTNFEVEAEKLS